MFIFADTVQIRSDYLSPHIMVTNVLSILGSILSRRGHTLDASMMVYAEDALQIYDYLCTALGIEMESSYVHGAPTT